MPEYLSPAVYVEEVSSGIRPIEGVGTSTGAFVGRALKGPVNKPVLITNQTQLFNTFGAFFPGYNLPYAVQHFFLEGGTRCYVVRVLDDDAGVASTVLQDDGGNGVLQVDALSQGAWGNRITVEIGSPAFHPSDFDANGNRVGEPKFSLTVIYRSSPEADPEVVESYPRLSMKEFTDEQLPNPLHVERLIDGVSQYIFVVDMSDDPANLEVPAGGSFQLAGGNLGAPLTANQYIGQVETDTDPASGLYAFDTVDNINIVAIPDLAGLDDRTAARDAVIQGFTYCENRADCFFVADTPSNQSPQQALEYKQGRGAFPGNAFNSQYGALYYPWILITDPLTGNRIPFPPSGAVVGSYSATDVRRGVHKAPAGTEDGYLNVAADIERIITKGEHDTLNPEGVNVIRKFPEAGIVIWGARTVSADPEWKYVNVRRLFLFLEESIDEGTQYVVFEPNDQTLWKRIIRNVSAFLRIQWSEGKLVGNTPEEAFFVKCDEETNPPESVDLGRVITLIGVAPSKPAEFVIFRIMQQRPGGGPESI